MEKSMTKARTKSDISQTSSETVTDAAKASDAQRKENEQAMRIRHVEGLRIRMESMGGEDMSQMVDPESTDKSGVYAKKPFSDAELARLRAKNTDIRTRSATKRSENATKLAAQMAALGINPTDPGISRDNPLTQLRIDPKTNKPFMTRAKPKKTLRGLLKRVFSKVGEVLAGSHLNVATKPTVSPSAYGGMVNPPRTRKGQVLAGSHLNVAPTKPTVSPSAYGGMVNPPRTRQGQVLTGSHLNVATKPTVSPSAYGGMVNPPRTRQGQSPK